MDVAATELRARSARECLHGRSLSFNPGKLKVPPPAAVARSSRKDIRPPKHSVPAPPEPPFPPSTQLVTSCNGLLRAEKKFWQSPGLSTPCRVRRMGSTPNPTYREVCPWNGVYHRGGPRGLRPCEGGARRPLRVFWESHDPTQVMRQGNDVGTVPFGIHLENKRPAGSSRYLARRVPEAPECRRLRADHDRRSRKGAFLRRGLPPANLAKNPDGYCGLGERGVLSLQQRLWLRPVVTPPRRLTPRER